MTPEEARHLIPYALNADELSHWAEPVKDALETIADMRWEYAAHAPDFGDLPRSWMAVGHMTYVENYAIWVRRREHLKDFRSWRDHFVIARRLVSKPEVTE